MTRLAPLALVLLGLGLPAPALAQAGPPLGMIYCHLWQGNQSPPKEANVTVLLSRTFPTAVSETAQYDVLATGDADNLMAGMTFKWVTFKSDGEITLHSEKAANDDRWLLVMMPGGHAPLLDAGLGNTKIGSKPQFHGVCDRLQMNDAEAEFRSHPAKPSAVQ